MDYLWPPTTEWLPDIMTIYTIKLGIAALVAIRQEDQSTLAATYMGPDPLPIQGAQARVTWEDARSSRPVNSATLPQVLVAAVNRHFGNVFSIPVSQRQAYLDGMGGEFTVEVPDGDHQ